MGRRRTLRLLDYLMKQPHILDYNLTVDHQLPWKVGLTLGYAGSRGYHLMQVKEGQSCGPANPCRLLEVLAIDCSTDQPQLGSIELHTALLMDETQLQLRLFARKKYAGQATGRERVCGVPRRILQYSQSPELCDERHLSTGLCRKYKRGSAASDSGSHYHNGIGPFAPDSVCAEASILTGSMSWPSCVSFASAPRKSFEARRSSAV
jgi:hypothetical protein